MNVEIGCPLKALRPELNQSLALRRPEFFVLTDEH